MIETPLLSEIESDHPKGKITEWPFYQINRDCRLYYKVIDPEDGEKYGFYFYSVGWTGNECSPEFQENPMDSFDSKNPSCEILLQGVAFFDGVRHLYFGDDRSKNYGYFNYPDFGVIVLILKKLAELEINFCQNPPKREIQ